MAHSTYVHHMALDPSGGLLATCSSDSTVEIFRRCVPGDPCSWVLGCTMNDHSGPVLRLSWCQQREQGTLLATVGADRWIYVYCITVTSHEGRTVVQPVRWTPVRGFEKDAITDVAFVPPQQYHVRLLSTASVDGSVRLYEIQQPLQFPCICRITPEEAGVKSGVLDDVGNPGSARRIGGPSHTGSTIGSTSTEGAPNGTGRGGGITSIAWFPGAAEVTMTLAVGAVSGRFYLYRYLKEQNTFRSVTVPASLGPIVCRSPVEDVEWAPPVGRRFQMLAICSRTEVFILRLNCISPSREENYSFEVFHYPGWAVSASWSRSATLLYLATDDRRAKMSVLEMSNPGDHQSWEVVTQHSSAHEDRA